MYDFLKFVHVLGVTILLGNVTVTAFWKVLADLTESPALIAHAQRGVIVADWLFTLSGIVLLLVGGFGAAAVGGLPIFTVGWLVQGEILFAVSGVIWLGVLVPLQMRQAKAARGFADGGAVPDSYRRQSKAWLIWGIVATVPLIAGVYIMIVKP